MEKHAARRAAESLLGRSPQGNEKLFPLLQHGVQLIGQVVKHAADVVQDAHRGFLLRHRAASKHREEETSETGEDRRHWKSLSMNESEVPDAVQTQPN